MADAIRVSASRANTRGIKRTPVGAAGLGLDALGVLREAVSYLKDLEEHKTERERIQAKRDCVIEGMRLRKALFTQYVDRCFRERQQVLERYYNLLDRGIAEHNDKLLDGALGGIVAVLQESPLKDIETFRQCLGEGKPTLEF